MVTPSACSTTLIRTSAGSLLRPRFTATTSTSFPPPDASIDPFTPTISIVLPPARAPCQRNSLPGWAWRGGGVTPAGGRRGGAGAGGGARVGGGSMGGVPGFGGGWPWGGPEGRDSHGALDSEAGRRVGSIFPAMSTLAPATIRAPTGTALSCKGWHQEAALRMLMNNLDPAVAERPEELVVYGGSGKAARNWACFEKIVETLRRLENDETLLGQSGKPVGVFRTHAEAPRVLIANAHLVPRWATWDEFRRLEAMGLTMYGQMTAGSWIYIGTQGILQGTYETFAECARQYFGGTLAGRLVVTAGLGGMGGAQPLAATMNGAAFLGIEVDPARIRRRVETGYCDRLATDLDEALALVLEAKRTRAALSVGLVGNVAEVMPELVRRGVPVDVVTDQTSATFPT